MLASTRARPPRTPRHVATTFGAACDRSRSCAIVCAVITGSVTSTARSSRCIAPRRAAASPYVREMTVAGTRPFELFGAAMHDVAVRRTESNRFDPGMLRRIRTYQRVIGRGIDRITMPDTVLDRRGQIDASVVTA